MDAKEFKRMYEQDWPPPLEIPADAPKPWCVMGDGRAVRNVMTTDYYAPPRDNRYWQTASGPVANVTHRDQLRGIRGGTLFVLCPPAGFSREQAAIYEEARVCGFEIRDFPTKRGT